MGTRRLVVRVVGIALLPACRASSESGVGTGSSVVVATTAINEAEPTGAATASPMTTPPEPGPTTTAADTATSAPGWLASGDTIVSASGGEVGLGGPAEVAGLSTIRDPVVGEPWLRFDLVLTSCCGEQNSVVFEPGPDGGFAIDVGSPPVLRVLGPVCTDPVTCEPTSRTISIGGPDAVSVPFEVVPLVPIDELRGLGPLRGSVPARYDYTHPNLQDVAMTIGLRIDVLDASLAPAGSTTPLSSPAAPVSTVGGGFELLQFPVAAVLDTPAQLAAALATSTHPVDIEALGIDWSTDAAIVLTIPTDACPPLLAGVAMQDRTARPMFVSAGYNGCIQPLLSHTVVAAVDRAVLADVDELVLPAEASYFDRDVRAPVVITPAAGASAPTPGVPEFGDIRGTADLPSIGEATVTTLDDGTPLYVIRHHDGTISALDPRAAVNSPDASQHLQLLRWTAATRILLGGGAWDEYGRRLDGFRTTDLTGYATRVTGTTVEIGGPVPAPTGTPIVATSDPPAMASATVPLDEPLDLGAALALPVGNTAVFDATVIVDPSGAYICEPGPQSFPIPPCPPGSPIAVGIDAQPNSRSAWFGPVLATRTVDGFTLIAPTGGSAGEALSPNHPP